MAETIIGKSPSKVVQSNIGNGYATYALVDGVWYSVNINNQSDTVSDVRWIASTHERNQITAILSSRLKRP